MKNNKIDKNFENRDSNTDNVFESKNNPNPYLSNDIKRNFNPNFANYQHTDFVNISSDEYHNFNNITPTSSFHKNSVSPIISIDPNIQPSASFNDNLKASMSINDSLKSSILSDEGIKSNLLINEPTASGLYQRFNLDNNFKNSSINNIEHNPITASCSSSSFIVPDKLRKNIPQNNMPFNTVNNTSNSSFDSINYFNNDDIFKNKIFCSKNNYQSDKPLIPNYGNQRNYISLNQKYKQSLPDSFDYINSGDFENINVNRKNFICKGEFNNLSNENTKLIGNNNMVFNDQSFYTKGHISSDDISKSSTLINDPSKNYSTLNDSLLNNTSVNYTNINESNNQIKLDTSGIELRKLSSNGISYQPVDKKVQDQINFEKKVEGSENDFENTSLTKKISSQISNNKNNSLVLEKIDEDYDTGRFSYIEAISKCILSSEENQASVSDIYLYLNEKYKKEIQEIESRSVDWKNMVRYTLSMNSCFYKAMKKETGMGNFWGVQPQFVTPFKNNNFKRTWDVKRKNRSNKDGYRRNTSSSKRMRRNTNNSKNKKKVKSPNPYNTANNKLYYSSAHHRSLDEFNPIYNNNSFMFDPKSCLPIDMLNMATSATNISPYCFDPSMQNSHQQLSSISGFKNMAQNIDQISPYFDPNSINPIAPYHLNHNLYEMVENNKSNPHQSLNGQYMPFLPPHQSQQILNAIHIPSVGNVNNSTKTQHLSPISANQFSSTTFDNNCSSKQFNFRNNNFLNQYEKNSENISPLHNVRPEFLDKSNSSNLAHPPPTYHFQQYENRNVNNPNINVSNPANFVSAPNNRQMTPTNPEPNSNYFMLPNVSVNKSNNINNSYSNINHFPLPSTQQQNGYEFNKNIRFNNMK